MDSVMEGMMPETGSYPEQSTNRASEVPEDITATQLKVRNMFKQVVMPGSFSKNEIDLMMRSILEVLDVEDSPTEDQDTDNDDDGNDGEGDLEDQESRTEGLKGILHYLGALWWAGSEYLDLVTEKLADSSRDPRWRRPLGNSGILDFCLEILASGSLKHSLAIHVLRLIGNSCADTDGNRARLVASNLLPSVILQLHDVTLLPFAIPVLYNICIDYVPAQQQASNLQLSKELVDLVSGPRFKGRESFTEHVCKLLALMISQAGEVELAPENIGIVLLKMAAEKETPADLDDFLALVNTAISYLQHERFQKALVKGDGVETALTVLVDSYTRFDSHTPISLPSPGDLDEAKVLTQMRSNLNQVMSDVSALEEFKEIVPVVSPLSSSLRRWLSSPQIQLQVCACIMLGNLARSDVACEEFVNTSQVHKPLITILTDANDSQLLHAALGFLKNIALPMKNKVILGEAGLIDVLPRLWGLDTLQQIQFSSISVARHLINGTFKNVRRICSRLSQDDHSPASSRTKLSFLISLFERTDIDPIKMEISRLVTALCRVFNTHEKDDVLEYAAERQQFFRRHPDIGHPLAFMVTQTKWPVVRSEGWFVFALMARYPEGAECISEMMNDVGVFSVLVELMTGKNIVDYQSSSSPSVSPESTLDINVNTPGMTMFGGQPAEAVQPHAQALDMQNKDRMNAMVLLKEMLKNRGDKMAVMRTALFEDLLQEAGEKVLSSRDGGVHKTKTAPDNGEKGKLWIGDILQEAAEEI